MDTKEQICEKSKFPDTLSFFIIPGMFWQNLMKIGQIYIPYKFAQSVCILPKIKCETLAHKGLQTTCTTPGDYLASWNCKPMGQLDLLTSMMMDLDFSGRVTHCRHISFYHDHSVERWGWRHNNEQSC